MSAERSSVPRLLLVLVLALSALLQATVVSRTKVNAPLRVDALDYYSYAVNLRDHGVYSLQRFWLSDPARVPPPDAVRPPGYALFVMALNPSVSWQWLRKIGYVQSVFAVLSVLLVYLVGRRFLDPGWALLAAFLTAICPSLVVMSTYVLSETLFTFLLLLATFASLAALRRPADWRFALLAGLAWGASALVRPTTQFLPALFLLLALVLPWLKPLRRTAGIALLGFVLALAPWIARNQTLPPAPAGDSLMVKALAHGSYPDFMYEGDIKSLGYPYNSDPNAAERAKDLGSFAHYLAADFRAHPLRMLRWYLVGKPAAFLSWADPQSWDIFIYAVDSSPYFDNPWLNRSWQAMSALHPVFVVLAVAAMLLALWRPRLFAAGQHARASVVLVALVLAYAIAFHMLVAPFPRYNVPFRPMVFLLAALALQAGWRWLRARRGVAAAEPALG